jgi:hypothetical protein
MKFELVFLAVILALVLMLVTSCQNRSKPFQDSMKRWREYREQKRQVIDDRSTPNDQDEDPHRWRERRRIFPRGLECET